MSKGHEALKETARKILQEQGFQESEIKEEYSVGSNGLKSFRVDVVGLSENHKVAIECGTTPGEKIAALKMFFDEVIILPYFTVNIEHEQYIKTIRQLSEKIIILEKSNKKLQEEREDQSSKNSLMFQISNDFIELLSRWGKHDRFFFNKLNESSITLIQELKNKIDQLERKLTANRDDDFP